MPYCNKLPNGTEFMSKEYILEVAYTIAQRDGFGSAILQQIT
nr:MAG TPA: hypothetical protein [Caudoviricetes sp.]